MNKYTALIVVVSAIAILSGCSETTQTNQLKGSPGSPTVANPVGVQPEESYAMTPAVVTEETTPEVVAKVEVAVSEEAITPDLLVETEGSSAAVIKKEPDLLSAPEPSAEYNFPTRAPINLQRQFKEYDSDKDGYLSEAEYRSYISRWLSRNHPEIDPEVWVPRQVANKDQNGDGILSPEEVFARYL